MDLIQMGCTAKNDTCFVCLKKIGTNERFSIYILNKGYAHESCWNKEKFEKKEEKKAIMPSSQQVSD